METHHLYSSRHVATIFGVALETVRNWADEFEPYLSPTATPGKGKHRMYTLDDLKVFALVADMKKRGNTYEEIHASLRVGSRGQPPVLPPDEVQALVVGEQERRLSLEVEYLQRSMMKLQQQLEEAERQLKEAWAIKEEKIRLEVRFEEEQKRTLEKERRISQLQSDLENARARIEALLREVGRSYADGMSEAMKWRGEVKPKE